jgi:hypothetical protein
MMVKRSVLRVEQEKNLDEKTELSIVELIVELSVCIFLNTIGTNVSGLSLFIVMLST